MDAQETLVIILAIALGLFLLMGIIFMVLLVSIAIKVRRITKVAHDAIEDVESATRMFKQMAAPSIVAKFVIEQVNKFMANKSKKEKS